MRATMFRLLKLCIIVVVFAISCRADGEKLAVEDLKKYKTKELKRFLADRGLSCNGCAEKDDFVKMAFENQDAPIVKKEPVVEPEPAASADKDASVEELMEKLRSSGFGNAKMFTRDDLDKMKTEDDISKNFGGSGAKPKPSRKSKGSKASKKTATEEDTTEL